MEALIKQWSSLDLDQHQSNSEHICRETACSVFEKNEQVARDIFQSFKDRELEVAIKGSISKGLEVVSLSVPFSVLDTKAYNEFKNWALGQSLAVQVFGYIKEQAKTGQDFVVLSVMPINA